MFFPMKTKTAVKLIGVGSLIFAIFDQKAIISHNGHLGGLFGGILYAWFALKPELYESSTEIHNESLKKQFDLKAKLNDLFFSIKNIRNKKKLESPVIEVKTISDVPTSTNIFPEKNTENQSSLLKTSEEYSPIEKSYEEKFSLEKSSEEKTNIAKTSIEKTNIETNVPSSKNKKLVFDPESGEFKI